MRRPRGSYLKLKRLVDLTAGILLVVPTVVVLAVVVPVGLLRQGGPVLFTQERIGRHGRPFRLVKLRTMAGTPGGERSWREHNRITPWGRVLRRLKLDELPQVLHLLTGQMSLVGPRPLLAHHLKEAGGAGRRHDVRPGFTCYAQLELIEYGYLDRYRQITLDEQYVDRLSPRTDLAILARTLRVLLSRNRPRPQFTPDGAEIPRAAKRDSADEA